MVVVLLVDTTFALLKERTVDGLETTGEIPIPPGSDISPFTIPSASPSLPSSIVRMRTLSPSSSLSREVASTQLPSITFQYCAPTGISSGYVMLNAAVDEDGINCAVKLKNPCGNDTSGLPVVGNVFSSIDVNDEKPA